MSLNSEGIDGWNNRKPKDTTAESNKNSLSSNGIGNSRLSETSLNSRNAQTMNRELDEILRMSAENLSDSFVPMEDVFRQQYGTEIVEESLLLKDEFLLFLLNLNAIVWPTLKNCPKNFYEAICVKLEKCLQFTPVSKNFNFTSCTVSQFWAVIILTTKCCGEIFATTRIGYLLLSLLFTKAITAIIFIYIIMPIFVYLSFKKTPLSKLCLAERRWLVMLYSFWTGASTHYILINWDPGEFPPPPLYSTTLVAVLFEFTGPILADNRPMLLFSTIGVASFVCFTYAYLNACLTFTYFYTSISAIASSFYDLQQHLADPNLGRGNIMEAYVILPIKSMYMQLAMMLLFGHYVWDRDPRAAVPDSLEERYTLLLHRLH